MKLRRGPILQLLCGLALCLFACAPHSNDDTNTLGSDPAVTEGGTQQVFAYFNLAAMPLPNDVVWELSREETDDPALPAPVRLEIEADDSADLASLKTLVNAMGLNGLSPNMFLTLPVDGAVDLGTLEVLAFRIDGEADLDVRMRPHFVPVDGARLKLLPATPLAPGARYAVAVKASLLDLEGYPVRPDATMSALLQNEELLFTEEGPLARLEGLRAAFHDGVGGAPPLLDAIAGVSAQATGTPWTADNLLLVWTFHTAAVTPSLTPTDADPANRVTSYASGIDATLDALKAQSAAVDTTGSLEWLMNPATGLWGATPVGLTAVQAGLDQLLPDTSNIGLIYSARFQSIDLNAENEDPGVVPLVLITPAAGCTSPYPVAVFQHGIGRDKSDAFALANTLGGACVATLALDAPFHGDRTPVGTSPTTGADYASGELFFTLNLLANRANLYQAAVDLWEVFDLVEAPGIDLGSGGALGTPHFVSHSLGSIIGSVFLARDDRPGKVYLSSPSAQLGNVLDATQLESLSALLGSLGFTPGATDYYVFLNIVQWLLDPTDSAYTRVGDNDLDDLIGVFAYGDPVVTTSSSRTFMTNVGDAGTPTTVDPTTISTDPGTWPATSAGFYEFGSTGVPVVHSFLLSPSIRDEDGTLDPIYAEGYEEVEAAQTQALIGAQGQLATFLASP